MPIYEYECQKCKTQIEVLLKMSDKGPTKCRECGGRLDKVISASAIQFKGSGWYVTDYGKATKGGKSESEPAADKKTEKSDKASEKQTESSSAKKSSEKASPSKKSTSD